MYWILKYEFLYIIKNNTLIVNNSTINHSTLQLISTFFFYRPSTAKPISEWASPAGPCWEGKGEISKPASKLSGEVEKGRSIPFAEWHKNQSAVPSRCESQTWSSDLTLFEVDAHNPQATEPPLFILKNLFPLSDAASLYP